MPTLLLLNGAPAVGKSTVARRFLDDHPLALLVEVDGLRTSLGQWQAVDDSKNAARTLALTLADAHLQRGYDVVVPQYLGRTEFIEALAAVATRRRTRFLEVVLVDDTAELLRRFRARRDELTRTGEMHPEGDVASGDLEGLVDDWVERLARIHELRPDTRLISARHGVDDTYAAVLGLLTDEDPTSSPHPQPTVHWNAVCLDCRDADELAGFYASLLRWDITARNRDWIQLTDPLGEVALNVQAEAWYTPPVWPEQPGQQTKMAHLEIHVEDLDFAVAYAERIGARVAARQPVGRDQTKLRVMLDPAGHPFCLWTI